MSIWASIKGWFSQTSKPLVATWIPKASVMPPYADNPIVAEEAYLRIWLVEMVLGNSRNWFKDYQPSVQALSTLSFGDQTIELPSIAAADPSRYAPGNSVLNNYLLLDLVPFHGKSVAIEAGLVALPGDDHLGSALKAISNVAGLVAAPLGQVLTIANKVKESADMLVGQGAEVHLAYHNTFTAEPGANQLRAGYLAIVRADPAQFNPAGLIVSGDQLRWWDGQTAQPLRGFDYMLLRFEGLSRRDDLRSFSDLSALRKAALDAFIKDGDEAGNRAYRAALAAIISHPELINADRRVLATELKADCDLYRGSAHGAAPDAAPRSWSDFTKDLPAGTDHASISIAEFI
jgi:hypothetical protein